MPVGEIYQVTFNYEMYGQRLMNVTHWRTDAVADPEPSALTRTQQVADHFANDVIVGRAAHGLKQIISSDVTLEFVQAQVIDPIRFAYRRSEVDAFGLRGANDVVNMDTVVSKLTTVVRKGGKGRMHLPPGGAADYVNGEIESDDYKVTVLQNLLWLWTAADIGADGMQLAPIIWRGADEFPQYDLVDGIVVQDTARVMTRRTVGRGI